MTGRSIVLLDVDGVLNPVAESTDELGRAPYGELAEWVTDVVTIRGIEYLVRAHRSVCEFLGRLHEVAEVRWLTTWSHSDRCNSVIAPLVGLPELPIESYERYRHWSKYVYPASPYWWKLSAAQEAARRAPDRPLVWVDDDICLSPWAVQWAESASRGRPSPVEAVVPDCHLGLTMQDMDRIDRLVRAAERGATP